MGKNTAKQSVHLDLSEIEGFGDALAGFSPTEVLRIAGTAVGEGGKLLVRTIKPHVPTRTGALRKSITWKVVTYPSLKVVLVVGPSRGRFLGGRQIKRGGRTLRGVDQPSRYAHLVEFGHHIIGGGRGGSIGFSKAKGFRLDPKRAARQGHRVGKAAAFVPARPFMRKGTAQAEPFLPQVIGDGLGVGLLREHKNVLRKTRRLRRAA